MRGTQGTPISTLIHLDSLELWAFFDDFWFDVIRYSRAELSPDGLQSWAPYGRRTSLAAAHSGFELAVSFFSASSKNWGMPDFPGARRINAEPQTRGFRSTTAFLQTLSNCFFIFTWDDSREGGWTLAVHVNNFLPMIGTAG
jgi:hypothetical protein